MIAYGIKWKCKGPFQVIYVESIEISTVKQGA